MNKKNPILYFFLAFVTICIGAWLQGADSSLSFDEMISRAVTKISGGSPEVDVLIENTKVENSFIVPSGCESALFKVTSGWTVDSPFVTKGKGGVYLVDGIVWKADFLLFVPMDDNTACRVEERYITVP